jgi:hypothetical protein
MKSQRGYLSGSAGEWGCAVLILAGLCAVVGMVLLAIAQWLWPMLKVWLLTYLKGGE